MKELLQILRALFASPCVRHDGYRGHVPPRAPPMLLFGYQPNSSGAGEPLPPPRKP